MENTVEICIEIGEQRRKQDETHKLEFVQNMLTQLMTELEMPNWHLKMHEERYG